MINELSIITNYLRAIVRFLIFFLSSNPWRRRRLPHFVPPQTSAPAAPTIQLSFPSPLPPRHHRGGTLPPGRAGYSPISWGTVSSGGHRRSTAALLSGTAGLKPPGGKGRLIATQAIGTYVPIVPGRLCPFIFFVFFPLFGSALLLREIRSSVNRPPCCCGSFRKDSKYRGLPSANFECGKILIDVGIWETVHNAWCRRRGAYG